MAIRQTLHDNEFAAHTFPDKGDALKRFALACEAINVNVDLMTIIRTVADVIHRAGGPTFLADDIYAAFAVYSLRFHNAQMPAALDALNKLMSVMARVQQELASKDYSKFARFNARKSREDDPDDPYDPTEED